MKRTNARPQCGQCGPGEARLASFDTADMAVTGYSGTDGIVRPPPPESGELEGQFRDYSGGEAVTGTSDRAMLATDEACRTC